jgi:hypothetical protein
MPHISFLDTTKKIKTKKTKPKKGTRVMLGDIGTLTTQITLQKERLKTKLHVNKNDGGNYFETSTLKNIQEKIKLSYQVLESISS